LPHWLDADTDIDYWLLRLSLMIFSFIIVFHYTLAFFLQLFADIIFAIIDWYYFHFDITIFLSFITPLIFLFFSFIFIITIDYCFWFSFFHVIDIFAFSLFSFIIFIIFRLFHYFISHWLYFSSLLFFTFLHFIDYAFRHCHFIFIFIFFAFIDYSFHIIISLYHWHCHWMMRLIAFSFYEALVGFHSSISDFLFHYLFLHYISLRGIYFSSSFSSDGWAERLTWGQLDDSQRVIWPGQLIGWGQRPQWLAGQMAGLMAEAESLLAEDTFDLILLILHYWWPLMIARYWDWLTLYIDIDIF